MRRLLTLATVLALCHALPGQSAPVPVKARAALPAVPAFPEAEGFGCQTPGGRAGRVLQVTTLADDGPGSLRAAIETRGRRTVVFRIGGALRLTRELEVREPFITIAGQTAPGDGVCLQGAGLLIATHDVVLRHLRIRPGDAPDGPDPEYRDALRIEGGEAHGIVLDHCSFSWGVSANVRVRQGARDLTVQWCISSEALRDSLHPAGPLGHGLAVEGEPDRIAVHHCLLAHNPLHAVPAAGGSAAFDIRDNVLHDCGAPAQETGEQRIESILARAGAIRPVRDLVDARVVQQVRDGKGACIDTPEDVNGAPPYQGGEPPADTDRDGMPDEWERQHGLVAWRATDGPQDPDADGYTNLEEYLNGTNPRDAAESDPPEPAAAPLQKRAPRAGGMQALAGTRLRAPADFAAQVRASGKDVADYLGLTFVRIEPGMFAKKPVPDGAVTVTLSRPFEMGAHEVTQRQWTRAVGTRPWRGKPWAIDKPEHAVTYVSLADCLEFLARLNACGGRRYRLPTEAEWEYACRAGSDSVCGFAPADLDAFAWHHGNTVAAGVCAAQAVGVKQPNAWGLCDMAGNVMEWCADSFDPTYWSASGEQGSRRTDPRNAAHIPCLVVRGGSFYYRAAQLFEYPARGHRMGYAGFDVGLRLARE